MEKPIKFVRIYIELKGDRMIGASYVVPPGQGKQVAGILRNLADKVEQEQVEPVDGRKSLDEDGNVIGEYTVDGATAVTHIVDESIIYMAA